jgi:integrase
MTSARQGLRRKDVKGVKSYVKIVKGKAYPYRQHRATGVRLTHEPGSAADLQQIRQLDERVKRKNAVKAGTLTSLIAAYKASKKFQQKAPRTRKDYDRVFNWLKGAGDMHLVDFTPVFVTKMRDKAETESGFRFANYIISVVSTVFNWGSQRGFTAGNPAHKIERADRPKGMPKTNRAWKEDEWITVRDAASPQLRWVISVGRFLGMREGDCATVKWASVNGEIASWTARKNRMAAEIPIRDELIAERTRYLGWLSGRTTPINPGPDDPACVQRTGDHWTESGIRASLFKLIRQLKKDGKVGPNLTFHGLRTTYAVELAPFGDNRDIAGALADKSPRMADVYAEEERRGRRVKNLMRKMKKGDEE